MLKYVPGMNDQNQPNQPKLSLDEELDVLEAVYKIGKEKGLDLLRPEQVKKLEDAGRMRMVSGASNQNIRETIVPLTGKQKKTVRNFYIARETTVQLRDSLRKDFPKFFESPLPDDAVELKLLYDDVFRMIYGTSPQFFANDLFMKLNSFEAETNG